MIIKYLYFEIFGICYYNVISFVNCNFYGIRQIVKFFFKVFCCVEYFDIVIIRVIDYNLVFVVYCKKIWFIKMFIF